MMRKKSIRIGIVFAVLAVVIAAWYLPGVLFSKPAERKMLFSCDFSEGSGRFSQDAYQAGTSRFGVQPDGGRANSACLSLENPVENDARYTVTLDVLPETYYRLSVWIRTEDVEAGNEGNGANLSVLNTFYAAGGLCGSTDWTRVEYYGRTGDGQKSMTVCLRLGFYSDVTTGKAWFDDLEIEQLDVLPEGVQAVSFANAMAAGSGAYGKQIAYYEDTLKIGALLLAAALLIALCMYRYAILRDTQRIGSGFTARKEETPLPVCVGFLLAAGLVLRLILSVSVPQCNIDVNLFRYWGERCFADGIPDFYANAETYNLDYPPLYIYFLWFNTFLTRLFGLSGTAGAVLLVKLPSMLADCAIGYLIYKCCDRRMSRNWVLLVLSVWLFNPVVLLDSAAWGQVDSLISLPLLLTVYALSKDRFLPAAAALGLAVILKPQGIFLVPIFGYAWLRRLFREKENGVLRTVGLGFASAGVFAATVTLVALPFGVKRGQGFFRWLIELYIGTANGYKGATVNAYNFFYLIGQNWTDDATVWELGASYFTWGMLFIVVACLIAGALYLAGEKHAGLPFLVSAAMVFAVTTFGPRMHERYFFPCLILLLFAVLYYNDKILLGLYAGISAVNFLSVLSVMMGLETGALLKDAGAPVSIYGWYYWAGESFHRTALAALNLLLCAVLLGYAAVLAFRPERQKQMWKLEESERETEE